MASKNQIQVHVFGGSQELFVKLFPKEGNIIKKEFGEIVERFNKRDMFDKILFFKNQMDVEWIGYKYPELLESNYKKILFDSFKSIRDSMNKKNVIIKFGNKYLKEFKILINKIETDNPCVLFDFTEEEEIDKNFFESFKKPQYISYIQEEKDENDPNREYNKIISYLWEKDCYYNEAGNLSCQFTPANLLYKPPKGFIYCNILLTGESRAGKSCFINRMFNKVTTYESAKLESTTREITYYDLFLPETYEDKTDKKLVKNGFGGVRIMDTPGLVKTKNLNSFNLIKSKLDAEFSHIHIVYFFLKSQSNIEQCIDMLKYIKVKNLEREKKQKSKIPIIFVKNGEELVKGGNGSVFFQQLKNELKRHDLIELYDDNINQTTKIEETEDDFFKDEEENIDDYQKYVDGNIVQVHIPSGKNMNKIFLTTKEYIYKNNALVLSNELDTEFENMKNNASQLLKFFIKEKKKKLSLTNEEKETYKILFKKGSEFAQKLKRNCSLLYSLDILDVKSKDKITAARVIAPVINGILGSLWIFSFGITFAISIIFLAGVYLFVKKNMVGNIAIKYGFGEKDIDEYGLEEYIYEKEDDKEKVDKNLEKKIKILFMDIIYYVGPIQCSLKSKESLSQIFEIFETLSAKKEDDWNKFKVEKI